MELVLQLARRQVRVVEPIQLFFLMERKVLVCVARVIDFRSPVAE
jgi:hypothetical protein